VKGWETNLIRPRTFSPIYITENGCAASDDVAEDGHVYDSDRLMYLRNAMMWNPRATSEGIPLKGNGNFYWSAMDNFEWITTTPWS
jgi:beta-glucosidase